MKMEKIEGMKIPYNHYFTSKIIWCPFQKKNTLGDLISVGSEDCKFCKKHIAMNQLKHFVICKGGKDGKDNPELAKEGI